MVMEVSLNVYHCVARESTLTGVAVSQAPEWPSYATNATNFVFRKDKSYIEDDDDRAEGVAYINSLVR